MRKTVLYWDPNTTTILEPQRDKLKSLSVSYPELLINQGVPKNIFQLCDYIVLTSSQGYEDNDSWKNNTNIIGIIVYCLQLNETKKKSIENLSQTKVALTVTNNFSKLISSIVQFLGYGESSMYSQIEDSEENRFIVHQKRVKNPEEQFSNPEQYLIRGHRILLKMFELPFNIEETPLKKIKLLLESQLNGFLRNKKLPIIQKQLTKIQSAQTLQDLCRAAIYYYTLEKPALYYNLNLILKNLRYVKFQQDFCTIRIFAFLLLLNYFFVYSGDDVLPSNLLYRYTDYSPKNYYVGSVITVTSFYSVSSIDPLDTKKLKKTKMVIHPLGNQNNLSLISRIPAFLYSAYPKEQQYLYAPFTRFKIISIAQNIIHLQQLPRNIFLARIMDINLLPGVNHSNTTNQYDWEIKYQFKYENFKHLAEKMKQQTLRKVYYNMGILNFQNGRNYKLAIEYFQRGLEIAIKSKLPHQIAIGFNNIGLSRYKLGQMKEARVSFSEAQKVGNQNITFKINLYNNLASVSEQQEKYEQAILLYEKGLSLLRSSQLNNPFLQATLLNNIAFCKSSIMDDQKQVIKLFQAVQQKYIAIYGDEYFDENVACEENLAQSYKKIGMLHQAHNHLKNAERIQNQIGQPISNVLLSILLAIAQLLNQINKYEDSSQYYQRALELSEKLNGCYHRTTSIICYNIGSVEQSLGYYESSLRYYDRCIQIVTTPYRPENNDIFEKAIELRQFLVQSMQKQVQFEQKMKNLVEQNNRKNEQWRKMIKEQNSQK